MSIEEKTKAIILAGGLGTRLGKYTENKPKCMLEFLGKSIIQRQVELLYEGGIEEIIVVRKHLPEKIIIPPKISQGVTYIDETDYSTHMVVGLMEARRYFDSNVILLYGDVLFERSVLEKVKDFSGEVGIVVDCDWREYWKARHGSDQVDTESMILDGEKIVSLGLPDPPQADLHARYVGMIKFSKKGLEKAMIIYDQAKKVFWEKPWYTSKSLKRAYMTDFFQAQIDSGVDVRAILISHRWLEFDTVADYEKALQWEKEGSLGRFYDPQK